jgi:hypothetical protein
MYLLNDVFPAGTPAPLFTTIFLGANDAVKLEFNARQHVPLSEYVANLRLIVRHIQALGSPTHPAHILLLAPPPIDEACYQDVFRRQFSLTMAEVQDRTYEQSRGYAKACVELAVEMGYGDFLGALSLSLSLSFHGSAFEV